MFIGTLLNMAVLILEETVNRLELKLCSFFCSSFLNSKGSGFLDYTIVKKPL